PPNYHTDRREQRARALQRKYKNDPRVVYVDAAAYIHHDAFTAVAVRSNSNNNPLDSITVRTPIPEQAEEAATALALTLNPTPATIITDSNTAFQNFTAGRISATALKILRRNPSLSQVQLIWTSLHSGLEENEAAHDLARGLTIRAGPSPYSFHGTPFRAGTSDRISRHWHLLPPLPQNLPQAGRSLSSEQSHFWRQPQAGDFPNPATMTHIHPSLYPNSACPLCGAHANLAHINWVCPQNSFPKIPSDERWETSLRGPDPNLQACLAKRVEEVAGRPWPTATTGPPTYTLKKPA
ncbi:hypothetical protein HPB47_009237, partial [Ixodes persulcatus]